MLHKRAAFPLSGGRGGTLRLADAVLKEIYPAAHSVNVSSLYSAGIRTDGNRILLLPQRSIEQEMNRISPRFLCNSFGIQDTAE